MSEEVSGFRRSSYSLLKRQESRIYQNWKPDFTNFDCCCFRSNIYFAKEEINICSRN